ncbi:DUF928 domain-containing protein [Pantanalinema rosaneae CENA516]|uniref:DUF928 domain-containing protein n=1 Tax=Pantanalinema rosaneae TaxID=1620701 RepID=UPI003D6EC0AB
MPVPTLYRLGLHVGMALCLVFTATGMPVLAQSGSSDRSEFPGRRIGGGTRGDCAMNSQSLVALNPVNNLGITASDRPTVYFVVPQAAETYPIQFVLRDGEGTSVYQTTLATNKAKELVGVQLPKNTVKVGQDYQWYFSVVCDADDSSQNLVLSGWLRRVASEMAVSKPGDVDTQLILANRYQAAGLWSDQIATLAALRQTHPNHAQVRQQWQQLLQTLQLPQVVNLSIARQ